MVVSLISSSMVATGVQAAGGGRRPTRDSLPTVVSRNGNRGWDGLKLHMPSCVHLTREGEGRGRPVQTLQTSVSELHHP